MGMEIYKKKMLEMTEELMKLRDESGKLKETNAKLIYRINELESNKGPSSNTSSCDLNNPFNECNEDDAELKARVATLEDALRLANTESEALREEVFRRRVLEE